MLKIKSQDCVQILKDYFRLISRRRGYLCLINRLNRNFDENKTKERVECINGEQENLSILFKRSGKREVFSNSEKSR